MKFVQLLSTIAALSIFATAPGVSAAGLRAGGDRTEETREEASGRRSLYVKHYGMPGTVPGMSTGPLVGPIHTMGGPGVMPGVPGTMGVPGEYASDYSNNGNYDDDYGDDDDYDSDYDNDYSGSGNNYSNGSGSGNCCKSTQNQGCPRDMSVVRATSACGQTTYQLCCDSAGAGSMSCNGYSIQAFANANRVNDWCYA